MFRVYHSVSDLCPADEGGGGRGGKGQNMDSPYFFLNYGQSLSIFDLSQTWTEGVKYALSILNMDRFRESPKV